MNTQHPEWIGVYKDENMYRAAYRILDESGRIKTSNTEEQTEKAVKNQLPKSKLELSHSPINNEITDISHLVKGKSLPKETAEKIEAYNAHLKSEQEVTIRLETQKTLLENFKKELLKEINQLPEANFSLELFSNSK